MRFFMALVALSFVSVMAQSDGGIITKSSTPALSAWNVEQATNAMVQPYTMKMADSSKVGSISTKYGTHLKLCRIANIAQSAKYLQVIVSVSGDTAKVCIPAQSVSERLPFISAVLSGAVADSTRYDFLYK
jgi:hypothetical protein